MASIKNLQSALIKWGFSVGPTGADGVFGRNTIAGIKAFQTAKKLPVTGTFDAATTSMLVGVPEAFLPWMEEAKRYLGLHEVRDAKKLDSLLDIDASETPWCGAFVGFVIAQTLPKAIIPANPLWARNWANFGVQDVATTASPHYGAIAVFSRNTGGHVGFVVGHDKDYVFVLGGNQSNSVSVTKVAKSQLLAYRFPSGIAPYGAPLLFSTFNAGVFDNGA